jgi:hypothetical protein
MINIEQARREYTVAKDALNTIARSDDATAAQRDDARAARDELTLDYINTMAVEGDALTQQYQNFIVKMTAVVDQLSSDNTVATSLLAVQGVVDRANKLIG